MTPVYHVARTEEGARAYVRRAMDGVEAGARVASLNGWVPQALLRSDQEWLRERLEERGIECVQTDPEGARRHVSEAMMEAGAEALRLRVGSFRFDDYRGVAREIFLAMERAR